MTAFHDEKRIVLETDVRMDRKAEPGAVPPQDFAKDKKEKRERV
jgi:hypothetical protein